MSWADSDSQQHSLTIRTDDADELFGILKAVKHIVRWSKEKAAQSQSETPQEPQAQLVQKQQGICPVCHQHLENGEELHIHHVVPKKSGGKEDLANLWLVHHNCHRQLHSSSAPLGVRRLLEPRTR